MDKSKVANCKFGGVADAAASTSSSIQCRSTTEKFVTIKQSKYPALPFARMLDDESWLSGSELKTDNSTSEDEEVRGTFVVGKYYHFQGDKRRMRNYVIVLGTKTRLRSKGKRRISSIRKVMTFSSSSSTTSSTSKSYQRMTTTAQSAGSKEVIMTEPISCHGDLNIFTSRTWTMNW